MDREKLKNSVLHLQGMYEKGARDEIEEFIFQVVDVTGDGIVGR